MSDELCKCSMSIALCGEGCRYCQPQNHIDHMLEWLEDERQENETLKAEVDKVNSQNVDVWAILNGLGLRMYNEEETIQMVQERAEKAEAERDRLREMHDELSVEINKLLNHKGGQHGRLFQ